MALSEVGSWIGTSRRVAGGTREEARGAEEEVLLPATALSCDNEAVEDDFVDMLGGNGGLDGEVAVISGPRGGGAFRQVFVVCRSTSPSATLAMQGAAKDSHRFGQARDESSGVSTYDWPMLEFLKAACNERCRRVGVGDARRISIAGPSVFVCYVVSITRLQHSVFQSWEDASTDAHCIHVICLEIFPKYHQNI